MSNVRLYVDGFNLYHRALKGTSHKWLDLNALASRLLKAGDTVDCIRYFTARVKPRADDPDAGKRQQAYLSALSTLPNVVVHYRSFLNKTIMRPRVTAGGGIGAFVEVHTSEEKGSDVNLASYLLHDAHLKKFDAALVISQDSDLLEPIRLVRRELRKTVGVAWLSGNPPSTFRSAASFVRHVTAADLNASQFADPLPLANGKQATKPAGW